MEGLEFLNYELADHLRPRLLSKTFSIDVQVVHLTAPPHSPPPPISLLPVFLVTSWERLMPLQSLTSDQLYSTKTAKPVSCVGMRQKWWLVGSFIICLRTIAVCLPLPSPFDPSNFHMSNIYTSTRITRDVRDAFFTVGTLSKVPTKQRCKFVRLMTGI